ncbi:glycosyltransferase [Pseudomonas palleroniana]
MAFRPVVSVVCVVYNHEHFISQAIESFLCQETNFPYEIVIHDDASTDKTFDVISQYCEQYPDRIKYVRQPDNVYSQGARIFDTAIAFASGEFIALCEGDDFWTDPKKLQLQYDLLVTNPDMGAVFGDANVYYQASGVTLFAHDRSRGMVPPSGWVRDSLLRANPYKTCTVMLRREAVQGYAAHASKLHARMDDYVAWLHIAGHYRIGYLPEVLGTYRVLEQSASHFSEGAGKLRFERSAYKVSAYFCDLYGSTLPRELLKSGYSFNMFMFFCRARKFKKAFGYVYCSTEFVRLLWFGVFRSVLRKMRKLCGGMDRSRAIP